MVKFKQMKFVFGQVHISGGHTSKATPASVMSVDDASLDTNITFVKMASTEQWLLLTTTGSTKPVGGPFGRTTLLERLREQLGQFCDGETSLAPIAAAASAERDPMDAIEHDEAISPHGTKRQGQHRMRYYTNHARGTVQTVSMPVRCPEEDPGCTDVRQVRLYVLDRKTIWLHIDDVEWAVRFLFMQCHLKGVPLVHDDSTGPA